MATIALYLLAVAISIQLGYWLLLFYRLRPENPKGFEGKPSSIIICFKDEAANLKRTTKHIAHQTKSEVIYIDDFSSDGSVSIVVDTALPNSIISKPDRDLPGKKAALYKGMGLAAHEIVCLTDADCTPKTEWAERMSRHIGESDVLLGYAPMDKTAGLVNTFGRYETYLTAIQYLSYAQAGMAYMGVGRNMAVKKSVALPILEKMVDDGLASGDDDLLVQAAVLSGDVGTILDPKTFVYSPSATTWGAYLRQKSRHVTTSTSYRPLHQILLSIFAGTHILTFTLSLLVAFIYPAFIPWVGALLLGKWLVQMIVNWRLMDILEERDLWMKFPLLDIGTFLYYIILTPYIFIKKRSSWN